MAVLLQVKRKNLDINLMPRKGKEFLTHDPLRKVCKRWVEKIIQSGTCHGSASSDVRALSDTAPLPEIAADSSQLQRLFFFSLTTWWRLWEVAKS